MGTIFPCPEDRVLRDYEEEKDMYRVVIADGDRASRDLLAQALSIDDCQIEMVSRGKDVLRHLTKGQVDILITEVHLADMPAWNLIPQVHQIDRDLPVITMTADDTLETSRRVRLEGGPVFFYGLKPLNLREMREVVRGVVRWQQKRRQEGKAG